MAARHDKECYEKENLNIFSCLQRTVERWEKRAKRGGAVFRRYGRELLSKPVISLKKTLEGCRRTTQNHLDMAA